MEQRVQSGSIFPKSVGPPALNLVDVLPNHPTKTYGRRQLGDIEYLVIHHTGVDMTGTPVEIAEGVARYHIDTYNWPGCGYHAIIAKGGEIMLTNYFTTVSYNVAGRNKECLGICLEGNFTTHSPTGSQLMALDALLTYLQQELPWTEITFHKEIALPEYPTSCPGNLFPYESF